MQTAPAAGLPHTPNMKLGQGSGSQLPRHAHAGKHLAALKPDQGAAGEAMVVGLGGGALPMYLRQAHGLSVTVVELDAVIVDLAQRHFGLAADPHLKVWSHATHAR